MGFLSFGLKIKGSQSVGIFNQQFLELGFETNRSATITIKILLQSVWILNQQFLELWFETNISAYINNKILLISVWILNQKFLSKGSILINLLNYKIFCGFPQASTVRKNPLNPLKSYILLVLP